MTIQVALTVKTYRTVKFSPNPVIFRSTVSLQINYNRTQNKVIKMWYRSSKKAKNLEVSLYNHRGLARRRYKTLTSLMNFKLWTTHLIKFLCLSCHNKFRMALNQKMKIKKTLMEYKVQIIFNFLKKVLHTIAHVGKHFLLQYGLA